MTDRIRIRDGRAAIRDTYISVAAVLGCLAAWDRARVLREYPALTDADLDAALAYGWPAITEPGVSAERIEVRCVCGERVEGDGGQSAAGFRVRCPACDKRWRITLRIDPV